MTRRRFLALLACAALSASVPGHAAEPALVLVASAHSAIQRLSPDETRKLYLGIPMIVDGKRVRPLRNNTDPLVQEMFMQKVMFMSTPAYERQILSRVFRMGGTRPAAYGDMNELLKAIEADPAAVTYLTRERAAARPGLKIVGEL